MVLAYASTLTINIYGILEIPMSLPGFGAWKTESSPFIIEKHAPNYLEWPKNYMIPPSLD